MEMEITASQQLWGTEFDKQYTKEMLLDLTKRATALTRRYERYTTRKSTDTAEDRIHTAVMKLMDGARTWDPTRVDLRGFLLGVIASDLTSELRRAKLVPLISSDDRRRAREDDYSGEVCDESGIECRASVEDGMPMPLVPESIDAAWAIAMEHFYATAGDDKLVVGLLGAWEQDVFLKREVMAHLKWSSRTYEKAYGRLMALANAADPSVREAILHVLAN
jgi:hypothetical protein